MGDDDGAGIRRRELRHVPGAPASRRSSSRSSACRPSSRGSRRRPEPRAREPLADGLAQRRDVDRRPARRATRHQRGRRGRLRVRRQQTVEPRRSGRRACSTGASAVPCRSRPPPSPAEPPRVRIGPSPPGCARCASISVSISWNWRPCHRGGSGSRSPTSVGPSKRSALRCAWVRRGRRDVDRRQGNRPGTQRVCHVALPRESQGRRGSPWNSCPGLYAHHTSSMAVYGRQ